MADHRERSQLIGDALREGAILLAVLYPLETIVATQFNDKLRIDWSYVILAEVLAGILFLWGIILEGKEDL